MLILAIVGEMKGKLSLPTVKYCSRALFNLTQNRLKPKCHNEIPTTVSI